MYQYGSDVNQYDKNLGNSTIMIQELKFDDPIAVELFERQTQLASQLIHSPISFVTIINDQKEQTLGLVGSASPLASISEPPPTSVFCQHVILTGEPLIIENVFEHPLVKENPVAADSGKLSYLGVPLTTQSGHTIGSFCLVDVEIRQWTEEEITTARTMARSVMVEIELRHEIKLLKNKEGELRRIEQQLRSLVEMAPGAIVVVNSEGQIVLVNKQVETMFQYPGSELLGQFVEKLLPGSFQGVHKKHRLEYFTKLEIRSMGTGRDLMGKRKDGSVFPIEVGLGYTQTDRGILVLAFISDITRRKLIEEKLRKSEERYRSVVTTLSEGIVLQNREGEILTSNPSAERILGLTLDQMKGRTSIDPQWQVIHEDGSPFPGEDHPAMVTLKTGKPQYNVIMGVHKPIGRLTWISINTQPMTHPEEEQPFAVVATFTDITELREMQQEAFLAKLDQERREILSEFTQDALHEFRTPLTTIKTSAFLITKSVDEHMLHRRVGKINGQVDALSRLIDDMMIMWKLDRDYPINRSQFDIGHLMRQTVQAFQHDNDQFPLVLECPDTPIRFLGDEYLIGLAFRNVLQNAIDHSPALIPIILRLLVEEKEYVIEVEDGGNGMDTEELEQIFNRFYRGDQAHKLRGFGLGLPIAKAIINLHHGQIKVTSVKNKGTIVTMQLLRQDN